MSAGIYDFTGDEEQPRPAAHIGQQPPYARLGRAARPGPGLGLTLTGLLAALAVIGVIVAVGLAAATLAKTNAAGDQPQTCVNMDQLTLLSNAITDTEGGSFAPADPSIAVGNDDDGGRIVVTVARRMAIFRKSTMERLALFGFSGCTTCRTATVTYDAIANRFFFAAVSVQGVIQALTLYTPQALADRSATELLTTVAPFGPTTYNVTGDITLASPADGCGTITGVTGMIALIINGGSCAFSNKTLNAQAAGAIGVLIYTVSGNTPLAMTCTTPGGCGAFTIPTVGLGNDVGVLIAASIAANETVTASMHAPNPQQYHSHVWVAASKSSAPSASTDFWWFEVTSLASYNTSYSDVPHHATTADMMVVATQDFGTTQVGAGIADNYLGAHNVALNKQDLMDGVGATVLWEVHILDRYETVPAETRVPIADPAQPMFLVCNNAPVHEATGNGLEIYMARASGMVSLLAINISLPEFSTESSKGRQPPVPGTTFTGLEALTFIFTAVVRQVGSRLYLYTAYSHNISLVHTAFSWVQIDITTAATDRVATLVQYGTYNVDLDLDVFYPRIDVDIDGNVLINAAISGPNQYASMMYTGRLRTDPPNTLRYPPILWAEGASTYWSGTTRNRWLDYSGGSIDPVDGKTFYMFGEIPRFGATLVNGTNLHWSAPIGTVQLNADGECKDRVKTHPALNPVNQAREDKAAAAALAAAAAASASVESAEAAEHWFPLGEDAI
jgi:hypothetical protein